MPLHKNILFCSRVVPPINRKKVVWRTVTFIGMYICVNVCVIGGVTEFRSSIIPGWHQLDSEVFTAAMPAHASDTWNRRIGDVCVLGPSDVRSKFKRSLLCCLSLHCLSCCTLNSLWGLKKGERMKAKMWTVFLHFYTKWIVLQLTFFFFFFWVLRLAELWSKAWKW